MKNGRGASDLGYADYDQSDKYVAATEAAVYEGTDEWPEVTWNFDCSTGDTSTWAQAGSYFNALMQESTGGKVKVEVFAGEQLTNSMQTLIPVLMWYLFRTSLKITMM